MKNNELKDIFSKTITITILAKDENFSKALLSEKCTFDVRKFKDINVYSVKIKEARFKRIISELAKHDLTLVGYVNTKHMYEIKSLS